MLPIGRTTHILTVVQQLNRTNAENTMFRKTTKQKMITVSYEELENRTKLLNEESGKKIRNALTIASQNLEGLRYSEIEMFLLILEREMKKNCELSRFGFENPPII